MFDLVNLFQATPTPELANVLWWLQRSGRSLTRIIAKDLQNGAPRQPRNVCFEKQLHSWSFEATNKATWRTNCFSMGISLPKNIPGKKTTMLKPFSLLHLLRSFFLFGWVGERVSQGNVFERVGCLFCFVWGFEREQNVWAKYVKL